MSVNALNAFRATLDANRGGEPQRVLITFSCLAIAAFLVTLHQRRVTR